MGGASFQCAFMTMFVLLNLVYVIAWSSFAIPWCQRILFTNETWIRGSEDLVVFDYLRIDTLILTTGVTMFVILLTSHGVCMLIKKRHMLLQVVYWAEWAGFELYYATHNSTRLLTGIIKVIVCVLMLGLAICAYVEILRDLTRYDIKMDIASRAEEASSIDNPEEDEEGADNESDHHDDADL